MTDHAISSAAAEETMGREDFKVLAASSVGTIFEWFDFFLYGSLAVLISRHFFAGVNESTAFVLALLAFAAGFAVRPLGAIVFGFLGDLVGRKKTFIITLSLMGGATFGVGLLPDYNQIGPAAAWILVTLRMLQGLSVGGVYGGAAVYVAEHVPANRRGFYTSFIQTTATIGMALSLVVIFTTRTIMGEAAFSDWGWRVPFLMSSVLLAVTIWIQTKLSESPVYLRMKASGKGSSHPWKDAFGNWANLKLILISLFGMTVGLAVVWYAAQFYVLFFLERVLKVDGALTNMLVALSLFIATPMFILFGWLSDKVGRKPILMGACLLAAITYFPLFKALTAAANPDLARAIASSPVTVVADPRECSFQFDPVGKATFSTSCDIARSYLTRAGVTYDGVEAAPGTIAELRVGDKVLPAFAGDSLPAAELAAKRTAWEKEAAGLVTSAGYPLGMVDADKINKPLVVFLITLLMIPAAMVYGPAAAMLAEVFPAKVRYTSLSLPYHLGTGWFGGFLPTVSFAIVAATGDIYSGLWYPLILAAVTFVIGVLFLPETKNADIKA